MKLIDFKNEIALATTFFTILQYLSGVLVCRKFIKRGSSNDISPLPFICGSASSSVWVAYGYLKNDPVILLVNSTGLFLMISYIITYTIYSTRRYLVLKKLFVLGAFLSSVHIYSKVQADKETLKNNLGFLGSCLTLVFLSAPLTDLARVLKTGSTEGLPFPMILANLVVCTLWVFYGVILEDDFLIYPSFVGCLLSGFQLSLFAKYPSTSLYLPTR